MAAGRASGSRGVRLQFKQKLISAQNKQLSTTELLKRLKNLHEELVKMDQELVVTESLSTVTRELINPSLIGHKDKGVRAYIASCLADLLRLYAPDAPYTDRELKEIFEFFVGQLRLVTNDQDPYFDCYYYLLENLANVKILLLILDLQHGEELLTQLFREFFDATMENTPKLVQGYFVDIMQQLIEDAQTLPQETVDAILAQFLKKRKEEHPAAYNLAGAVCRATTDKLQFYVCQYFTDVIVAAGKSGASAEEMNDFKTAHELIKELNRSAPGLLLNVIPQLEEELKLDDLNLRLLATQVLGEMFSEKGSTLALRNDSVWQVWLSRRNDKAAAVRSAWAEYCIPFYHNHLELAKQVNDAIKSKMSDPDEKVRIAFCKIFDQIDYASAYKLVDKELLIELANRCRDRKHGVRQEAINALARLYNLAFDDIVSKDPLAMEKFNWIPTQILNTLYTNDNEIIACVEKTIQEQMLPPNNDGSIRMERLLVLLESLDGKSKKGFFSLFQRQRDAISDMEVYLKLCEQYKGDDANEQDRKISSMLEQIIKRIAGKLPDPPKSSNHLSNLPKISDTRLFQLIRECMNPEFTYKIVRKAQKEALKKIEEASPPLLETFSILIRRISLTVINGELVPLLVNKLESLMASEVADQTKIAAAHELFKDISSRFPAIYRSHLDDLTRLLSDGADNMLVEDGLEALAHFSRSFPDETPQNNFCRERLTLYALNGSSPQQVKQAKFAAIILGQMRNRDQIYQELLEKIVPRLSIPSPKLLGHLSVLSELALHSSEKYEEKNEAITDFIVKELILKNRYQPKPKEEAWVDDEEIDDECKAKVLGIKILVNRLLALSEEQSAQESAKPIFKLLWTLIKEDGETPPNKSISPSFQSRLRLASANAVLKLARKKAYDRMISSADFEELALTIQDPLYQVRYGFTAKLIKYCGGHQLSARFLSIFFLIAHEPEPDIRDMVKVFLKRHSAAAKIQRDTALLFEMSLVRLICLLSHHPDFASTTQELTAFSKYIEFFLETIANADNVSFLYYITGRIKQVVDAHSPEQSDNLYILSDLCSHLIRDKCKSSSWTLLSYPGQVKLPGDLFKSLPNAGIMSEVMKKNYIPQEFLKVLERKHPSTHAKQEKISRKPRTQASKQSLRKRRKVDVPTRKSTPRAAKSKVKSLEEIEEDDSEESVHEDQSPESKTDEEMVDTEKFD